jgi:hypothetical protein
VHSPNPNGPIAPALRVISLITAAVLMAAGLGLFFLSDATRPLWPWEIGPFNAFFLGAVYLSSLAAMALLVWYGRWAPARLILPMLFVYTAVGLLVSLIYAGSFDFRRWAATAWFMLFLTLPLAAGYYLWRYRQVKPPDSFPTSTRWRVALLLNALMIGAYGFAMFAAPVALTSFWPWSVDPFHGRLYSVIFTTLAIGALGLSQFAAPVERLTLGLVYTVLGLFAVFGVVIVDADRHSVPWSHAGVWLWIGAFAAEFLLGLTLIWWSSNQREAGA